MKILIRSIAMAGLVLGGAAQADADAATPAEPVALKLPAQALRDALNSFASQTGLQVIYTAEEVTAGLSAPELEGTFTPEAALKRLLVNSGLRYEYLNAQTIAVVSNTTASQAPAKGASQAADATRMAQTESSSSADAAGQGGDEEGSSDVPASFDKAGISEIVVTAQKRTESLQDVPISISVLSGENLNKSTFLGVTEALRTVPGVVANISGQGGDTQLTVRGVSAAGPTLNGASPVAYYLDSAPFGLVKSAAIPDPSVYDLDRIEVLRGPQGTLYGANALNGVVRILTKDPELVGFKLQSRASISTTKAGGESERVDGAVNLPLISDKLAARAVVGYQDQAGWIDRPNSEDANVARTLTGRFKLKAEPTDRLSVVASAWLSRIDRGAPSTSINNRTSAILTAEPQSSDFDLYGLNATYDFSNFSVNSATSYLKYANNGFNAFEGCAICPLILETTFDADMFSQEVNIVSNLEGPWRWSIGGMYRDAEDVLIQYFGIFTPVVPIDYVQSSESAAIFGEVARRFLEGRLELAAGLRYFRDDVGQRERQDFERNIGAGNGLYDNTFKFDKVTPRTVLTWRPTDALTTYASYSEGFRSGADQNPNVRNAAPLLAPTKPDSLKNYELGLKSELWDRRLAFETAVFYIDWQDVQQSLLVPYQTTNVVAIVNGESASGMGFEAVVTARPFDGLSLGASFSWNDLELDSDVISGGAVLFPKGGRLATSPEYTAGAWVNYEFPLGGAGYRARLSTSANYTSEALYQTVAQTLSSDKLLFGNASFSIEAPAGWAATLFVENFSNEEGVYSAGLPSDGRDQHTRPRTFGVQLEYHY